MLLRNFIPWTLKNVFGNFIGRQEYGFVQDPLIVWHINRWSGGYGGSESRAKALWKYRKSKWSMGTFPCKKYFENLPCLLHSVWLSRSKPGCVVQQCQPQPCQGLCVTGAWVCTGPAEINRSRCRCRSHCKTRALDGRFMGLFLSTSFLYPFSASLQQNYFTCFPNPLFLHNTKRSGKKKLLAVQ